MGSKRSCNVPGMKCGGKGARMCPRKISPGHTRAPGMGRCRPRTLAGSARGRSARGMGRYRSHTHSRVPRHTRWRAGGCAPSPARARGSWVFPLVTARGRGPWHETLPVHPFTDGATAACHKRPVAPSVPGAWLWLRSPCRVRELQVVARPLSVAPCRASGLPSRRERPLPAVSCPARGLRVFHPSGSR